MAGHIGTFFSMKIMDPGMRVVSAEQVLLRQTLKRVNSFFILLFTTSDTFPDLLNLALSGLPVLPIVMIF
jgi:hypothetical protein